MGKLKKYYLSCNVFLFSLLYSSKAYAQEGVDALQGSDSTTTTVVETVESSSVNGADVVDKIRDAVPDASKDATLEQINGIIDAERANSSGLAREIAQPIVYVALLGANIIWYSVTALYMWQTAVDVLALSFSGLRSAFMTQSSMQQQAVNQGQEKPKFNIMGWIRSFFTVSLDFEQTLQEAGLSGAGNGQSAGGFGGNQGNFGGGFNQGGFGGQNYGNQSYGNQGGNQGSEKPRGGNLLRIYIWKRFWTLVWLGLTITLFATSRATNMQGDLVSWLWALLTMAWNFFAQFFR